MNIVGNWAGSLDTTVMLGLGLRLQQLLTDPDHLVSVPAVPIVYQDNRFRFDGPLDAAGANTLAEFSELVNRIPTYPVWSAPVTVHLWDIYGEILSADLAHSSLTPGEKQRYDSATSYLYKPSPTGGYEPSAALHDYRVARQAWLQADTEYRQAQQAASMSSDAAVRARWTQVDEPKLRQIRDEAMAAWQTTGHKNQVEDALRDLTELSSRSPSATWKRHRDTFSPDLPDQFTIAPSGTRYAPTFYTPSGALDTPWPRVVIPREALDALVKGGPPQEVTAALGGWTIDPWVQSVAFDYQAVSLVRPWLDPFMELVTSRAWKLPANASPLSDGGDPPRGRCPTYVESVVLARNIDTVRHRWTDKIIYSGQTTLRGGWCIRLDNGVLGGLERRGVSDILWEPQTEPPQMTPLRGVLISPFLTERDLAGGLDFDGIGTGMLEALSELVLFGKPVLGSHPVQGSHLQGDPGNGIREGEFAMVRTPENNLAKVQVVKYGYDMVIRWTTYEWTAPTNEHNTSKPEDVYIAAFICRRLPKCPNPDPTLTW